MEEQIRRLKKDMASLGRFRPGSLSKQYNVCGKVDCRCKETPPRKHGPHYQLSFTRRGKGTTRFVRWGHVTAIKADLRNYKRLQKMIDKWIELEMRLSEMRMEAAAR